MRPRLFVWMYLIFPVLCTLSVICTGQTAPSIRNPSSKDPVLSPNSTTRSRRFGWNSEDQAWKTEKWTADEKPYQLIRTDLLQKMLAHQLAEHDLQDFQDEWNKTPQDPKLLFRWVYASSLLYIAAVRDEPMSEVSSHSPPNHLDIADAYNQYPLTGSYEFDRIHLIFNIETGDNSYELLPTLKRFYDRDPNDVSVMHPYAVGLAASDQASDILLSAKIADRLVTLKPDIAMNHVLFGWCHYTAYWITLNPTDLDKASQGYHDFLRMSPPDDPFRPQATAFLLRLKPAVSLLPHTKGMKSAK